MRFSLLLPLYLGFASVLQGGLNRTLAKNWGLAGAALLNSLVLGFIGLLVFFVARGTPTRLPEIFRDPGTAFSNFSWWYLLPGLLGFSLVAGIPMALSRLGALQTFVVLIASQILASMAWDAFAEGKPVTLARVAGAVLAFLGAALVNFKG